LVDRLLGFPLKMKKFKLSIMMGIIWRQWLKFTLKVFHIIPEVEFSVRKKIC